MTVHQRPQVQHSPAIDPARLDRLAEVAIRVGLNLQPGQDLFLTAPLAALPLVRRIAEHAYRAGAGIVTPMFSDEEMTLARYRYAADASFDKAPAWLYKGVAEAFSANTARLAIVGDNPMLLANEDPAKVGRASKANSLAYQPALEKIAGFDINWNILAYPSAAWAKQVFPGDAEDVAVGKLAEAIFSASRIDQADPVDSVASETVEETAEPLEEVQPETVEAEPVEQEVAQPVTAEAPEPAIDDVVRDDPVEQEELAEVPPDPVEVPLPEVAMAVPQPRPRPAPVKERDPVEKPVEKKPARKPPPSAAARKPAEAAPRTAAPAPAPGTSAGRSVSPARWQARVNAHLNRYKRFPAGVRTGGMAVVQFTINPSGTVTSASLARSSGDGALDSAALALVQRASPIPAPPPEIARASMRLTVPIEFSRR